MKTYTDKQNVRHVLRIIRPSDSPGFWIVEDVETKQQLSVYRGDIHDEEPDASPKS